MSSSSSSYKVLFAILAYSFCSGTLVLLNKFTLHYIPFPSLVVAFQLSTTIAFIYTCSYCRCLLVDPIQWIYVKPYLYYTVAFSLGVFCNMRSLHTSNVETVIVFRALAPCFVSVLDVLFLNREYPKFKSIISLLVIVLGAFCYANNDNKFQTQGISAYKWPILYLCIISFEMVRKIVHSYPLHCCKSMLSMVGCGYFIGNYI